MKVGDKVISSRPMSNDSIETITRETKLYWIVGNTKYDKKTLRTTGPWSSSYIREYTEEDAKKIRKQNMIDYIYYKTIKNLDYDKVKTIYTWVKESEVDNEG